MNTSKEYLKTSKKQKQTIMKLIAILLLCNVAKMYCNCNVETKFNIFQYNDNTSDDNKGLKEFNVTAKTFTRTKDVNVKLSNGNLPVLCYEFLRHINDKRFIEIDDFRIKSFENDSFVDVKFINLESLKIANNRIYEIQEGVFKLSKLKMLTMLKNEIEHIADGAFKHLTNLKELHLPFNNIKSLSSDWFKYSPVLRSIVLNHNQISALEDVVFSGLKYANNCNTYGKFEEQCPVIIMSYNRIKNVSKDAFKGLNNVVAIGLDHNELSELPSAFEDVYVTILSYQYNVISYVNETLLEQYNARTNFTLLYGNKFTERSVRFIDKFNDLYGERIYYKQYSFVIGTIYE